MNRSDFHHTRNSLKCHHISQTGVMQRAHCCMCVLHSHHIVGHSLNFGGPLQKGLIIISDGLHCGFRCQSDQFLSGHIVSFHVCSGGHLAGRCVCASPGEILHILQNLATMSALGSWHVCCLGWVIWWSDRNKQGLLIESTYIYVFL